MKAYSKDFRLSVIQAIESKKVTKEEAISVFGCSRSTLTLWLRKYRETGDCEILSPTGRPQKLSQEDINRIDNVIKEKPDITLNEILEELKLDIKKSALSVYINKKLGYSYKKKFYEQKNKIEKMCK